MGLDMYLSGRKFMWNNHENPAANPTEDGFPVKERVLRLGYWRKHPDLHGYIVREFGEGRDECQEIDLEPDDLRKIIAAIKARQLPETTGFFFGQSAETDEQIAYDVGIFEKALAWRETAEPHVSRDVIYQASW